MSALILALAIAAYVLPTGWAFYKRHPKRGAIAVINLFLGWTVIGWIACAAWAASKDYE